MSITTWIAQYLMSSFPIKPSLEVTDYWEGLGEIAVRAFEAYEHESEVGYDGYFKIPIHNYFCDKFLLDFGCGHAGRTIKWIEKYKIGKAVGIDASGIHLRWAKYFIKDKKTEKLELVRSFGENLPFSNMTFDTIVSFDVFEHVDNPRLCLSECYRVLKKNGILIIVFPPYYSPNGSHLPFTFFPWLNVFFNEKTLIEANNNIAKSLGERYKKNYSFYPNKAEWGNSNVLGSVNGLSIKEFDKIIKEQNWRVIHKWNLPLFKHGQVVKRRRWLKSLSIVFGILNQIPLFKELFTHRVSRILQKIE